MVSYGISSCFIRFFFTFFSLLSHIVYISHCSLELSPVEFMFSSIMLLLYLLGSLSHIHRIQPEKIRTTNGIPNRIDFIHVLILFPARFSQNENKKKDSYIRNQFDFFSSVKYSCCMTYVRICSLALLFIDSSQNLIYRFPLLFSVLPLFRHCLNFSRRHFIIWVRCINRVNKKMNEKKEQVKRIYIQTPYIATASNTRYSFVFYLFCL